MSQWVILVESVNMFWPPTPPSEQIWPLLLINHWISVCWPPTWGSENFGLFMWMNIFNLQHEPMSNFGGISEYVLASNITQWTNLASFINQSLNIRMLASNMSQWILDYFYGSITEYMNAGLQHEAVNFGLLLWINHWIYECWPSTWASEFWTTFMDQWIEVMNNIDLFN